MHKPHSFASVAISNRYSKWPVFTIYIVPSFAGIWPLLFHYPLPSLSSINSGFFLHAPFSSTHRFPILSKSMARRTGHENNVLYRILCENQDEYDNQTPQEYEATNAIYRRALNATSASAGMEILRSEVPEDWRRHRRNMESYMAKEHGHTKDALPVFEKWVEEALALEEGDDGEVDFEYDILRDLWLADQGKNNKGETIPHYNVQSRRESLRRHVEGLAEDKETAVGWVFENSEVEDEEQRYPIAWKKCDSAGVVHMYDWKGDKMRVVERLPEPNSDNLSAE